MSIRYDRGGIIDVDVPVIDPAVDLDVADVTLGGGGSVLAGHVHHPEDRPGGVPILSERGLSPRQGRPAQFPVGMEPERVADHRDDPVLDAGMFERPGRGDGQNSRSRRGGDGSLRRRVGHRLLGRELRGVLFQGGRRGRQGTDQLILTHSVPADDPLVLGHPRQNLLIAVLERIDGHAGPLRLRPGPVVRSRKGQGTRGSSLSGPIRAAPCRPDRSEKPRTGSRTRITPPRDHDPTKKRPPEPSITVEWPPGIESDPVQKGDAMPGPHTDSTGSSLRRKILLFMKYQIAHAPVNPNSGVVSASRHIPTPGDPTRSHFSAQPSTIRDLNVLRRDIVKNFSKEPGWVVDLRFGAGMLILGDASEVVRRPPFRRFSI